MAALLGCVAGGLILSPADGQAQSLFFENFDAAQPASAYNGAIPDTGFEVTSGDVDIIGNITNGAPSGFFTCPYSGASANNCLDLNGNQPGAVTTTTGFALTAGTTYALSFNLAGSIPLGKPYTMQATIGTSAPFTFSVPAGNAFGTEVIDYTPAVTQPSANISFASTTNIKGSAEYGPLIDNVGLAAVGPAVAPATAGSTVLFTQDLSGATPGPNQTGALAGTGFTVTRGNVDVFGQPAGASGFYTCPSPLPSTQMCIDMNGDLPGRIVSDRTYNLTAGNTYTVQFEMAGNIPNGSLADYTLSASLGNSGLFTFSTPPDAAFQTYSFDYTPTTNQLGAQLMFESDQTQASLDYGPVLTDIVLTDPPGTADLPEPSTMLVFLAAVVSLAMVARTRTPSPAPDK